MCGARGAPRPWMTASGMRVEQRRLEPVAQRAERDALLPRARPPRARRRGRGRPPSRRSPCRGGGRDPASRRTSAAPSACRGGCTARRSPSARRSCARRSRAGRTASSRASIATLPNACTASVWKTTPRAFGARRRASAIVLHDADLVVHPHHRADRDIVAHQRVERRRRPRGRRSRTARQPLLAAFVRDLVQRAEHRLVLDRRRDGGLATARAARAPDAEERPCCPPRYRTR